jgi:hypothetical protein
MGFGSGGGGFTPSPNVVPGSTQTGTDKDTDVHQFTGSVDITGSLTLNGSPVGGGGGTPGGANTQVQFNDNGSFGGSANFTFDGNTITVSDDADIAAKIGRVNIGAVAGGTSDYAYFSHRDQASTNNYALQQRANGTTIVNAPSGGSLSLRLGQQNCLVVDGSRNNNIGINGNPEARLHVSANANEKDVFRADGDINNILYVSGSGVVGIGTGSPVQTLSVSGSAAFSGAFGSTAIETLTANGTISANTGLTLIDASSSLAVNNTLVFSIANGTFAGQEKKIRGLIISGSDGANSTGIYIAGTNIDSPPFLGGSGQIVLSSSNPAAGPSFQRAGCSLVWSGSKWLPVGNYNFNINSTGF